MIHLIFSKLFNREIYEHYQKFIREYVGKTGNLWYAKRELETVFTAGKIPASQLPPKYSGSKDWKTFTIQMKRVAVSLFWVSITILVKSSLSLSAYLFSWSDSLCEALAIRCDDMALFFDIK